MSKNIPTQDYFPSGRSALSGYVLAMAHAITTAGLDHKALMSKVDIDSSKLDCFGYRYSQEKVTKLWKLAIESTNDKNFGLKVAKHIRPSSYHIVGQAMLCSDNLRAATRRFSRFSKLISDSAMVNFHEKDEYCALSISLETGGSLPLYQALDTVLAGYLEYARWILQEQVTPLSVSFSHQQADHPEEYESLFNCPVYFGQKNNVLVLKNFDMDRAIPGANEEIACLLDELASRYLQERLQGRFSRRVRNSLNEKLPHGEPSRAETAQSLAMTERTLARRLTEEGTTYYQILRSLREEKAYEYLKDTVLNIEEVASYLGFSDRGTFSRAFKNWTGKRPSDWRAEQSHLRDEKHNEF